MPKGKAPTKFVIAVAGRTWRRGVRGSSRPATFYITSFHYGLGMQIKSFNYSDDKSKALQFGKLDAESYIKQIRIQGHVESA